MVKRAIRDACVDLKLHAYIHIYARGDAHSYPRVVPSLYSFLATSTCLVPWTTSIASNGKA